MCIFRSYRFLTINLLVISMVVSHGDAQVKLSMAQDSVEISNATQRIVFSKGHESSGAIQKNQYYRMATYVKQTISWVPFFDAMLPIVRGSHFNQEPTDYVVEKNDQECKRVKFISGDNWSITVEVSNKSPLISFFLSCNTDSFKLDGTEPDIAFWMKKNPELFVDQWPDSYYQCGNMPYNFTFPAAYLWKDGIEAAVFFEMSDSRTIVNAVGRFEGSHVRTFFDGNDIGFGLDTFKAEAQYHTGIIPKGTHVLQWYLYQNAEPEKPSKIQAIDKLIHIFTPLHSGQGTFPVTRKIDGPFVNGNNETRWEKYAGISMQQMMQKDMVKDVTIDWRDPPLNLLNITEPITYHTHNGDYSINFNLLSPWLLYSRLHPKQQNLYEFAINQTAGLPLHYFHKANLIAYGADLDNAEYELPPLMSWQDMWFHIDMLRVNNILPPEQFNPAIAGRALMGLEGLIQLAHENNYCFPQWFDAITKKATTQNDVPYTGTVYEPWQAGSYIYLMIQAYKITGRERYLQEAIRCADTLFETMNYTVSDRTQPPLVVEYKEVGEFPVTEVHGLGFGMLGAQDLYKITKIEKYQTYARYFCNTLVALSHWFEDNASDVARAIPSRGLFKPGGNARHTCPWEQGIAGSTIANFLKEFSQREDSAYIRLLLNLQNLNRVNGFAWYAPAWPEFVSDYNGRKAEKSPINYMPIEPLYAHEAPWMPWPPAVYKPLAHWNYWLYEALAEADPRDKVLVVNLDTQENYDAAVKGIEQNFIVYNPYSSTQKFKLKFKFLKDGKYTVVNTSSTGKHSKTDYRSSAMKEGLAMELDSFDYCRLKVVCRNAETLKAKITICRKSQNKIAYAYKLLQEQALEKGANSTLEKLKQEFQSAMHYYKDTQYEQAGNIAEQIVLKLNDHQ